MSSFKDGAVIPACSDLFVLQISFSSLLLTVLLPTPIWVSFFRSKSSPVWRVLLFRVITKSSWVSFSMPKYYFFSGRSCSFRRPTPNWFFPFLLAAFIKKQILYDIKVSFSFWIPPHLFRDFFLSEWWWRLFFKDLINDSWIRKTFCSNCVLVKPLVLPIDIVLARWLFLLFFSQ